MAVELDRDRLQPRRQLAGDGGDPTSAAEDDRGVAVARQDVRGEVTVGLDKDVAGAKLQGTGRRYEGDGDHQRERECNSPHPC